jgi:hypothetical protein
MSVKKLLYAITMGVCLLAACKKSKSTSVEDELINKVKADNPGCICDPYIKQYEWKGRIVYVQAVAGPACSSIPFYYNSSGERFELPGRITLDEFFAEATFIKDVWSCKESPLTHQ